MHYLVKTTEQYRVDTEAEAKKLIEKAKADKSYTLSKYSSEYRSTKSKGEISDEWFRVILVKEFNIEKEPTSTVAIIYAVDQGAFPDPIHKEESEGIEF